MDYALHPNAKTMNALHHSLPMLAEAATALDAAGYTVFSTMQQKPYVVRPFSIASAAYWAFDHDFTVQDNLDGPAMEVSWPTDESREEGLYSVAFMGEPDGRLSEDTTRRTGSAEAVTQAAHVFFRGHNPWKYRDLLWQSDWGTFGWLREQRDIFMAATVR